VEAGSIQCLDSGITRHLHFITSARAPELLARRLCRLGSLTLGAAQLLSRMIEAKLAFLISGGTGSGKTTLRLRHY
jgi:Flp pilus assembly CpaF family ATPase